jgi:hypothetical protein
LTAVLALVTIPTRPAIAPPQQLSRRRLAVQRQTSAHTTLNTTAAALHGGETPDAGLEIEGEKEAHSTRIPRRRLRFMRSW